MAKGKKDNKNKALIFLLVSAALVLVFANLIPKIQVYIKQPEASALISFPEDHAPHSTKFEWWYVNLITRTTKTDGTNQKDLAYLISFSRILNNFGLLSSRFDNDTKNFNEKTDTGGKLNVNLIDDLLYANYTNESTNLTLQELSPGNDRKKIYKLFGFTDQIGQINLTLKERKVVKGGINTPLLWGGTTPNCTGKISVFKENDTFYYSIPNLDITGTITDTDDIERIVKGGKAWIDHQWFDSTRPSNWKGHYWNSFHFSESGDIYDSSPHQAIGFVRQIYSTGPKYTYWVKRNANGKNECGQNANIKINSYGGTNYPSSWKINLKKSGNTFMQINGKSFSDNQVFTPPALSKFIEPFSQFSGNLNGNKISGLGFFETSLTKPQ